MRELHDAKAKYIGVDYHKKWPYIAMIGEQANVVRKGQSSQQQSSLGHKLINLTPLCVHGGKV